MPPAGQTEFLELMDGDQEPEWPTRKSHDPEDFELGLLLLQDAMGSWHERSALAHGGAEAS